MVTFLVALLALIGGYFIYGKIVDNLFGPTDKPTPALVHNDGVDYIPLPTWKVFMIQLLNIAGLGPIFGALGGALWGPSVYLWIVFGTIFAGGVHDYLSGMIVAGVFHRSAKCDTGALESRAGWKGLCKKCMTLLFVLIAHRLDLAIGVSYMRDAVVIGFIANELISITENAGLMGIPLPKVITKAIDILKTKSATELKVMNMIVQLLKMIYMMNLKVMNLLTENTKKQESFMLL